MKQEKKNRPTSPAISEEMKAWSAALATEVSTWPKATERVFFGFNALYRRDQIFAVLPRTRGITSGNALAFKLAPPPADLEPRLSQDPRIKPMQKERPRWFTFEMSSGSDLHDALEWLSRAYEHSRKRRKG